jgi:multidrug efflux pump subunit AcrA (membrane-fusion protein)
VVDADEKRALFVVGTDGRAHRREVELGIATPDEAEIARGLAAGETVIVSGHDALPDGATVTVEPAAP